MGKISIYSKLPDYWKISIYDEYIILNVIYWR